MGNHNSSSSAFNPTPNVRERHSRALYINIPVNQKSIQHLLCAPSVADGVSWVSIVVDDLDTLESYTLGTFIPTGLQGWMCKLNLLVKCKVPSSDDSIGSLTEVEVSGYQIVTIDFESGFGGIVKSLGAKLTQRIPSETASFIVSSGLSGTTIDSSLENGLPYSVEMTSSEEQKPLVQLSGTIRTSLTDEEKQFVQFVVNRPHKFLKQCNSSVDVDPPSFAALAYSPETGPGAVFNHEECVWIDVNTLTASSDEKDLSLAILRRLGGKFRHEKEVAKDKDNKEMEAPMPMLDLSRAKCFLQPYYILVDHHNTILS
jgi:hypothetical protein